MTMENVHPSTNQSKTEMKYTVSWMFNGKSFSEKFSTYTLAFLRQTQLEAFGLKPTVHEIG